MRTGFLRRLPLGAVITIAAGPVVESLGAALGEEVLSASALTNYV